MIPTLTWLLIAQDATSALMAGTLSPLLIILALFLATLSLRLQSSKTQ